VFIDCVNQLRIGGMEKREALVETGRMRLRPILMTAMTTILGMSTMALGHGTGAEMMQPMAVVSIGGLSYATLMTLFIVPVLYDLFNGKTMKAREIQMIKEAAGMTGDEVLDGNTRVEAEAPARISFMAAPLSEMARESTPAPVMHEPLPESAQPKPSPTSEPVAAPVETNAPAPAKAETTTSVRPLRIRLKPKRD